MQYSHLQRTKCEKKSTQGPNNKFFGVFTFENHNATLLRDTGIRLYTDASTYSAGTQDSATSLRKIQFSQRNLLHPIHILVSIFSNNNVYTFIQIYLIYCRI